jgi:signal transduction histidine kinase
MPMIDKPIRVLLVEDDAGDARLFQAMLTREARGEFLLARAGSLAQATAKLMDDGYDLVLSDLGLPDSQGLPTFLSLKAYAPRLPIVLLSGLGDEEVAVTALQLGAQDYLVKSQVNGQLLVRALRYAIERNRIESERDRLVLELEREVSERKQVEADLRVAKIAAESANRAKSEFLANMSHEIRTPMNGILGMTALTLDTELTAEQRDYLGMVKSSSERLLTVINDILDFSKIEAGHFELDLTEFDLERSVAAVMRNFGVRAQQKGLELALLIAPDVPEAVVGDAGRICQILVNLIGNAIKFTEQGEIVVRVKVAASDDDKVTR